MSLKLDGFLRTFRGKGDDLETFWSKFRVLADIQKWDTEEKRMQHLPLVLDGQAFKVFMSMAEADRKKEATVKALLEKAFAPAPADSYQQFLSRRLRPDEAVDGYVADLKHHLSLAGHKITDDKDPVLLEQVICGLPPTFARDIRLQGAGQALSVSDVTEKVRALQLVESAASSHAIGAAATEPAKSLYCYTCGKTGHVKKTCRAGNQEPSTQSSSAGPSSSKSSRVRCHHCHELGHIRRNCPTRRTRGTASAGVSDQPGGKTDCCLALTTSSSSLIRVYVDACRKKHDEWTRLSSVVDTGCTRSLISRAALQKCNGLRYMEQCPDNMLALNGESLKILGSVLLNLRRLDGPVHLDLLPAVSVLVVPDLSVLNTDMVVGNDVVTRAGGMHLQYADGCLLSVSFGCAAVPAAVSAAADVLPKPADSTARTSKLSRHVTVNHSGDDVTLSVDDGEVHWNAAAGYWSMKWHWRDDMPPAEPIGSGIGEYPRAKLTADQELQFNAEVDAWIQQGWLVPHDADVHGPPGAILPLIAKCQEHKASTPVRPVLDYRGLNQLIRNHPGCNTPVCGEKLRSWRQAGDNFHILDIRKAYLQVRLDPSLARFQTVIYKGKPYVMMRMGFGLGIAPKLMSLIVQYVTGPYPTVDSYVDDLFVPDDLVTTVEDEMVKFGLPTKPAECLRSARVLGLQLHSSNDVLQWRRRTDVDLCCPASPTKRDVFRWCGRLLGHNPVCSWLRPYTSYLKRLADSLTPGGWDAKVPPEVVSLCQELSGRVEGEDPVHGAWSAPPAAQWSVWCDASNIATGIVVQCGADVIEDACWLRPKDDRTHINVAELDSVMSGLQRATAYGLTSVRLLTDSKTVHGWLYNLLHDIRRVKTSGLYDVLVQRRLQAIDELVRLTGLSVVVEWVPSERNLADRLTRVPTPWLKLCRAKSEMCAVAGDTTNPAVAPPMAVATIRAAQQNDGPILAAIHEVSNGLPVSAACYRRVAAQLVVKAGLLRRSVKLPDGDIAEVPVVPESLTDELLDRAHNNTGHGAWESMYRTLRRHCYFPRMAERCQEIVSCCAQCCCANPRRGQIPPPTRTVLPDRPWSVIQLDTLELGASKSGEFHSVLVCIDMFSKWVEVAPLRRHDAQSVADAFVQICTRWGPPDMVRLDNGTEFINAIVRSVFAMFGVTIQTGAVRHPQSQGCVERFNRTLLTLMRKVLSESSDWNADLNTLLYFYRNRPHSATKISPMEAICGWTPHQLIADPDRTVNDGSNWSRDHPARCARLRDLVESELSDADRIQEETVPVYHTGDHVLLRRPDRHQKRLPMYEPGWQVIRVLSPSTVVIRRCEPVRGRNAEKVVNVDLIKLDPHPVAADADVDSADDRDDIPAIIQIDMDPQLDQAYGLRRRAAIRPPQRFRD
ncbi:uncharacterized protein LOC135813378 [Sycon ciliatum]|uniref:uncharacterized protein LOC135813378 n=1 Tax=Sycon ciliatum TaxID=27933 RepID=UPI0031F6CACF